MQAIKKVHAAVFALSRLDVHMNDALFVVHEGLASKNQRTVRMPTWTLAWRSANRKRRGAADIDRDLRGKRQGSGPDARRQVGHHAQAGARRAVPRDNGFLHR